MSEAKWYVVHTYSGYENKVKADIEKRGGFTAPFLLQKNVIVRADLVGRLLFFYFL